MRGERNLPSRQYLRRLFENLHDLCRESDLEFEAYIASIGALSLTPPEEIQDFKNRHRRGYLK
jgi:hypothetical protein